MPQAEIHGGGQEGKTLGKLISKNQLVMTIIRVFLIVIYQMSVVAYEFLNVNLGGRKRVCEIHPANYLDSYEKFLRGLLQKGVLCLCMLIKLYATRALVLSNWLRAI